MSQENVEIVRRLQPAPEVDLTEVFFRGDEEDEARAKADPAVLETFTEDFVCVFHGLSSEERPGVVGLRDAWLDWLEPWESYRAEIERLQDVGERVLVFTRDFGRRPDIEGEVEMKGIAIWTVRGGKVARAEFFPDRSEALAAAGLEE